VAAPGSFVNLHGLGYRSQIVVFYVHKLWNLGAPEQRDRIVFIGAERSPK
jgi:site-specific DNA-cytosine methylase